MGWAASRMEGLPVAKPIYQMMAAIDDVVLNAIRNNTLGPASPYAGWTVEEFQAKRIKPRSASRAPVGPKPPTHCKNGHPFDTTNTDTSVNRRRCKQCAREYSKQYDAERKSRGHFDKRRGWVEPNSNPRDSASHLQDPR